MCLTPRRADPGPVVVDDQMPDSHRMTPVVVFGGLLDERRHQRRDEFQMHDALAKTAIQLASAPAGFSGKVHKGQDEAEDVTKRANMKVGSKPVYGGCASAIWPCSSTHFAARALASDNQQPTVRSRSWGQPAPLG